MLNLTSQQQKVLCGMILLLLFGWVVKAWRQAHPPATASGAAAGIRNQSAGVTTN
jgi:hypothetical protein